MAKELQQRPQQTTNSIGRVGLMRLATNLTPEKIFADLPFQAFARPALFFAAPPEMPTGEDEFRTWLGDNNMPASAFSSLTIAPGGLATRPAKHSENRGDRRYKRQIVGVVIPSTDENYSSLIEECRVAYTLAGRDSRFMANMTKRVQEGTWQLAVRLGHLNAGQVTPNILPAISERMPEVIRLKHVTPQES
ncbi:MAG TPA: hypothetical protein VMY99_02335 [Nevskiaceae bacterium]|nr:hypothetical protein [Nevskiaceae bacterium]